MIDAFGQREMVDMTVKETGEDTINAIVMNKAIKASVDEVESYLFAAGLTTITPNAWLKQIACDVARFRLYENQATDEVDKRYNLAIDWLKFAIENPSALNGMGELGKGAKSIKQAYLHRR